MTHTAQPQRIGRHNPLTAPSGVRTWGERIDDIGARMDAAYAHRKAVLASGHKPGSAKYVAADDRIEAVYQDLRELNAEMGAGR